PHVSYTLSLHDALPICERERVSTQAARETRSQHAVIAAVNGDFFDNSAGFAGIPTGIFVVNGELLVNPWGPALGFAEDGRPFIEDRKSTRLNSSHVKIS